LRATAAARIRTCPPDKAIGKITDMRERSYMSSGISGMAVALGLSAEDRGFHFPGRVKGTETQVFQALV
jgi:hypothetical protein